MNFYEMVSQDSTNCLDLDCGISLRKRNPSLCSIDLYVTIESQDIIHNMTIPPKSFC
jgi:hypothetical protein